jgi:hypothetical protein
LTTIETKSAIKIVNTEMPENPVSKSITVNKADTDSIVSGQGIILSSWISRFDGTMIMLVIKAGEVY